jgi:hypothetical protein
MGGNFLISSTTDRLDVTVGEGSTRNTSGIEYKLNTPVKLALPASSSGVIYGVFDGNYQVLVNQATVQPPGSFLIGTWTTSATGVSAVTRSGFPGNQQATVVQTVSQLASVSSDYPVAIVTGSNSSPNAGDGLDGSGTYFLQTPDVDRIATDGIASNTSPGKYWFRSVPTVQRNIESGNRMRSSIGISGLAWMPQQSSSAAVSYRKAYNASANCTELQVHFVGAYNSSATITSFTTTVRCAIQLADGSNVPTGAPVSFTFSGSVTGTIPSGGVLTSDALPIILTAGQRFFIITYSPTTTFSYNGVLSGLSGDNYYNGDGITNYASITNDLSQEGANCFGPGMITGMVSPKDFNSVCIVGDSISAMYNDSNVDASGNPSLQRGWAQRAMPTKSVVSCGLGGWYAQGISTQFTGSAYLAQFPYRYVRDCLFNPGFNDFFGGTAAAATVQGYASTIVAAIRAAGVKRVIGCTVKPASTSTDGWATTVNQTARSEGGRTAYNAWVLANASNLFDGTFDFAGALADATTPTKLNPGPYTALLTDTVAASSSQFAIVCTSGGSRLKCASGVVKYISGGLTKYTQATSYRASGTLIVLIAIGSAPDIGSSYTVYQGWAGDTSGTGSHPSGYGHMAAASAWPATLLS